MRRRRYLEVAGMGGVTAIAGCSSLLSQGDSDSATLAALEPMSGALGDWWGNSHYRGLELAFEELNEGDSVDTELNLVRTDTQSDPQTANSAFERHVEQDNALAVTGAVSSDVGLRIAQTAEQMEIPNFLNQAGSQDILTRDSRYTFRVGWLPAPTHVKADIQYMEAQDISKVGAIIGDYAWGRAVESSMNNHMPDDIEFQIEAAPYDEDNFTSYIRRLPEDMDMFSVLGHPPGGASATAQMYELDIEVPVLGLDIPPALVINVLGENVTRDIIARQLCDVSSDKFQELGERYADRWDGTMYDFEIYGYMAGRMFGEAVAEEGTDSVAIADYVRSNTFDFGLYNNPIEYTEWGELQGPIMQYSEFVNEAPSYNPNGEYRLEPVYATDPLEPHDPDA